jgi:DNA invertase Pin-like site-specific DNA recombinase
MLIGYARTSTTDQSAGLGVQLVALKAAGCEELYQEQVSAVATVRPQLDALIRFARKGDSIVVMRLDRLARSVHDLLNIIKQIEEKDVGLRVLDFGGSAIDTKGPTGKLILTLVGAIGEFERTLMLERQRSGVAQAKADGKYKGRAPTARAKSADILELRRKGKTAETIADMLDVSRASVFRVLKANGQTRPSDATVPSRD